MLSLSPQPTSVVSAEIYALILSSRRLGQMLLPEGLARSPYEILDYDSELTLHDVKGSRATFRRRQRVRFLQDGVSAMLDHAWGDGVLTTYYDNSAGMLEDSFNDRGRRHWVVGLERAMGVGETLSFEVERTTMVGFTRDEEWLETTFDEPVGRQRCGVVFPRGRPCLRASLHCGDKELALPVERLGNGATLVRVEIPRTLPDASHTIRW